MEVNKNLQIVSERASYLCDRVNDEIYKYNNNNNNNESRMSLCRVCSENDRFCRIRETPLAFEECENLINIRDSLKDVENMLLFLQKQESRQQTELHEAFIRLEKSRLFLIQKVNQFPGKERRVDVIEELNACLADEKSIFPWKRKEKTERNVERNKISGFLVYCIRSLFSPLNWLSTARVATKAILVSASISSVLYCVERNENFQFQSRRRNIFPGSNSAGTGKMDYCSLDVLYGKG